jgi:hypothetical protein
MTTTTFPPTDESTHVPGPHRHWNESFYVNFFDANQGWSGSSRIGSSPNQGHADGFVCLYFPDNTTGFIRTWKALHDPPSENAVGPLQHTCLEPFRRWRLQYDGPIYHFSEPESMADFGRSVLADVPQKRLKLDLSFHSLHPPFDFHDSMRVRLIPWRDLSAKFRPRYVLDHLGPALRKARLVRTMSGGNHYEQAGRVQGSIEVDGQTFALDGFGQRDHSWGVRDMRVPANWRWLSCQFGETLCFNAIQVDVLALRVSGGYVFHQGQLDVVTKWICEPCYEDDERWPERVNVRLATRGGKQFQLHAKALAHIPVLATAGRYVTLVTASRGLYEWQGQTAHGMIEFMEQLP